MTDPDWHDAHPHPAHDELTEALLDLHRTLEPISLEFGHRSFREALRFAATLAATGVTDPDIGWDWIVMTKILPRVHGGRRQLESFLTELNRYAVGVDTEKPPRPLVARKTARMLRSLQATQFASFSE
jgi:5-methylcytosine-specific restriction protein B